MLFSRIAMESIAGNAFHQISGLVLFKVMISIS